ncbi:MAG: hypothetical protein ACE5FQ_04515 [Thiogranum sp.]
MHIPSCARIAPFGGRSFWLLVSLWLATGIPVAAGEADTWILRGTIVLNGTAGYAIVEQPGNPTQLWQQTGSAVLPGMHLAEVFTDHAIVVHDGVRKRIDFGTRLTAAAAIPPVTASYRIDPLRFAEIAAAVDIIPQQQDGQVVGYYANGIPEELRSEIGLQPGDLLRRINGIPLDDKLDPSYLHEMLQTGRLNVDVVRAGQSMQLVFQVGE